MAFGGKQGAMSLTIWHNPACSTSRHALALLNERGLAPEIVRYLNAPPSEAEIARVLGLLGAKPEAILRRKNAPEDALAAWSAAKTDKARIAALHAHPILIERPIVIAGGGAALVRPKTEAETILAKLGL
jgi:arsenate reductase